MGGVQRLEHLHHAFAAGGDAQPGTGIVNGQRFNFMILLAVLWFRWTLATDVLGAPGLTAAGFVVLDILLGLFISLGVAALIVGQPAG